jgi:hypothetical protein
MNRCSREFPGGTARRVHSVGVYFGLSALALLAACDGDDTGQTSTNVGTTGASAPEVFAERNEICAPGTTPVVVPPADEEVTELPPRTPTAILSRRAPNSRAAESIHRFVWGEPQSFAGACPIDVEVRLLTSNRVIPIATGLPDNGQYLIPIPDAAGEHARAFVTNSCNGESRALDEEFLITSSRRLDFAEWDLMNDNAQFPRRDGAGALVYRNRMWIIGGWNPDDRPNFPRITSNAVWSSRTGTDWRREKCNSYSPQFIADWEGRHTAGYAVFNNKMVVMGGDAISGHYQTDVWSSVSGETWTREDISGFNPFDRRVLFQTFVHDGKLCVYGGQTLPQLVPDETILYSDIWCSTDMRTWARIEGAQTPPARSAISGEAVSGNEVWILGGGKYHTPTTSMEKYNDVWVSTDLREWTRILEHAPWEPRLYHNVTVFDERLWIIAGIGEGILGDVWYSADGFNWYELQVPWAPRHASSVFVFRNSLWVAAGGPGVSGWHIANDVWRLTTCPAARCEGR